MSAEAGKRRLTRRELRQQAQNSRNTGGENNSKEISEVAVQSALGATVGIDSAPRRLRRRDLRAASYEIQADKAVESEKSSGADASEVLDTDTDSQSTAMSILATPYGDEEIYIEPYEEPASIDGEGKDRVPERQSVIARFEKQGKTFKASAVGESRREEAKIDMTSLTMGQGFKSVINKQNDLIDADVSSEGIPNWNEFFPPGMDANLGAVEALSKKEGTPENLPKRRRETRKNNNANAEVENFDRAEYDYENPDQLAWWHYLLIMAVLFIMGVLVGKYIFNGTLL